MAEPSVEKEKGKAWYVEFLDRTTLANVASFILVLYAGYKIVVSGELVSIKEIFTLLVGYLIGRSGK
jgi:hypothetical protein